MITHHEPESEADRKIAALDVVLIAKQIRRDIIMAKKHKAFPSDVNVSITINRFSGGRAINATVKQAQITKVTMTNLEKMLNRYRDVRVYSDGGGDNYRTCNYWSRVYFKRMEKKLRTTKKHKIV